MAGDRRMSSTGLCPVTDVHQPSADELGGIFLWMGRLRSCEQLQLGALSAIAGARVSSKFTQ